MPVVLATQEAEAGELLDLGGNRVRLCLKKKKKVPAGQIPLGFRAGDNLCGFGPHPMGLWLLYEKLGPNTLCGNYSV